MELEILEKVLINYQDSAIFVSDESSQQILFFNELCKDMFPEISEEMLVVFGTIVNVFDTVPE